MGSIRPSNIKRIAEDLVNKNPGVFNSDFNQNRESIKSSTNDVSKRTLNLVAGYVTRYVIKKETRTKKEIEEGTIVS
ncbi:MAG: 30S ribosomal protein S17e [Thermoplasmataceae archaeon]